MPDGISRLAGLVMEGGRRMARSFSRDWLVPTITPLVRKNALNSEAGEQNAALVYVQAGVAYNTGTKTSYMPFTANVSFIEPSGLSDDIVIG
jgi:hypothetical protein